MPDWRRRSLLVRGGTLGVAAVAAGLFGRSLVARAGAAPAAADEEIPPAGDVAPPLAAAPALWKMAS